MAPVAAAAPPFALDRFAWRELAELVDYPGPSFAHTLAECRRHAGKLAAAPARDLLAFLDWAAARPVTAVEEAYAATFDSSEECALEIGWHLYGEAYQRGVFLVEMRGRLRAHGIEEGAELPDHLSSLLRWFAVGEPGEVRRVARLAVAPALKRVVAGLAKKQDPWLPLVRALLAVLDPDGAAPMPAGPESTRLEEPGGCEGGR